MPVVYVPGGKVDLSELLSKIDELLSQIKPPSTGGTRQYTVGTSSVKLDEEEIKSVTIKADDDNTGNVFICIEKDPCDTSTGFRLAKGQGIDISIDNLSKITVVADAENQKIYVLWVK